MMFTRLLSRDRSADSTTHSREPRERNCEDFFTHYLTVVEVVLKNSLSCCERLLVSVVIWLVGSVFGDSQVFGLVRGQLGELDVQGF